MAEFKDLLKKWFYNNSSTAGTTSSRIPLLDSSGNPIGSNTVANVGSLFVNTTPLRAAVDGLFIMCHRRADNYPMMYKPHKWTAQQTAGEVADGVVVVEGGHVLVVAPTEASTTIPWGSASVAGGGGTTTNRVTAYSAWAGKTDTASQITHAEMSGAGYAPGFCHAYSRVNANGYGLTAGKWWLPSMGEMMMILANMSKINYALSLIDGATQLQEAWYWVSTEYNSARAWRLHTERCDLGYNDKASGSFRVRAVSEFIQ